MLSPASALDGSVPHLGSRVLEQPPRSSHLVQFYDAPSFLFESAGRFLSAGAAAGERLLVIAVPEHLEGIRDALSPALVAELLGAGRLTLVEAEELLAEFMRDGAPDAALFRAAVARIIGSGATPGAAPLRAFGEMVDLLWGRGLTRAAIRLEELWNEVGTDHQFSLLCAYSMTNFDREGDSEHFLQVCGQHSHVLPTETFARRADLDSALREISVLEQRSRLLDIEIRSRKKTEEQARRTLEQSDAFREVFINVLGHDLRNPLNTILTTIRLMALRAELPPDTERRLDRVITSGVRLERMIAQILDVARDHLASGISVSRAEARDLAPLVAKAAERVQAAHPRHELELRLRRCVASVDPERFEQVAFTLLDNAATHGDPDRPALVTLETQGQRATLSVRNHGPVIDKESLDLLFDPFRRVRKPIGRSAGLGLGLYICARILEAHGGELQVQSSEAAGTSFTASFPREP